MKNRILVKRIEQWRGLNTNGERGTHVSLTPMMRPGSQQYLLPLRACMTLDSAQSASVRPNWARGSVML